MLTVSFTGHRLLPSPCSKLEQATRQEVEQFINNGAMYFGCGGAIGFDTLAARTLLALRDGCYPHIKLIQVLPFKGMEHKWNQEQQVAFHEINQRADKVVWLAERYTGNEVYHIRNRYLVDHAASIVVYCEDINARSGTASCYRYAVSRGIKITRLEI